MVQVLIGLAPALATWRWPLVAAWAWVLLVAFAAPARTAAWRALAHADATVVVPMDFLRVPLTALACWPTDAERLDPLIVLGAALIFVPPAYHDVSRC